MEILLLMISLKTLSTAPLKKSALSKFGKVALRSRRRSTLIFFTFKPKSLAMSKSSLRFDAPFKALKLASVLIRLES